MLGKPGGHLGFTFEQHIKGLNLDNKNRFYVSFLDEMSDRSYNTISKFDIFWFYAKAFHPSIFEEIRSTFPNKKIIVGPNVLLDKPDIGICDEWDDWLINKAEFDLHLDQVEFYNNHVKKFFPDNRKNLSTHLDKCMRLDIFDKDIENTNRDIDCLVYSKKRRYDKNYENFRSGIVTGLKSLGVKTEIMNYGEYKKEDFLKKLLRSKVMMNLSLDECPGILNYEAFYCNTHVIGSNHNVPSHYDKTLWVEDTDSMTNSYLVRKDDAHIKYLKKFESFIKNYDKNVKDLKSPREYVLNHTSYQRYCDDLVQIINEKFGWNIST
jgi:hypothetical protein